MIELETVTAPFADHLYEGKVNLRDLLPQELRTFFSLLGQSSYRTGQLLRWLYLRRVSSFAEMTDLSHRLRETLEEVAVLPRLEWANSSNSVQDTTKFLFALPDGNCIESVKMRYLEHLGPGRVAVCLSSQVGCAMNCAFCASGKRGLVRSLKAWEMAEQAVQIQRLLDPLNERVANLVFMGIGEPLANLREVLRAICLLNCGDGFGVGMRHIAISTSGLVPAIYQLAEKKLPLKLALSLHATTDEVRSHIMPVNKRWPIGELLEACRVYQQATHRRLTFEYIMLDHLNDTLEDADRLVKLLRGLRCLVNLIPWNAIDHPTFKRSSHNRIRAFQERVNAGGLRCTLRCEKGADIDAACGQLRLRTMDSLGSAQGEEFDVDAYEND